jgi:hypothetical protein
VDTQSRRDRERQQHRARRVLRRRRHPDGAAGERPVLPPAALVDEQARHERDGHRRERHDVVERVLGVEDRQERDRHDRGRGEPDPALVVARPRPVRERHDERPDQRDHDARGHERGLPDVAHAADGVDHVEQVREPGRVLVVAGVQAAVEHPDRLRHEVLVLVGVEREREPVVEVPEPECEGDEQDAGEDQARLHAPDSP